MAVTSALVDSTLRTGSTGTASTVTGVQFGSAFADRVLVPAYLVGSVSQDPTSGTVDGQSAVVTGTNSSGQPGSGFLSAVVASGTSGNVVGNFSSSDTLAVAGVVALTGAGSATPSDTFAVLSTSSTIDVAAGGCVVAVAFAASSGSWTGATQLGSVAIPALGGTYYIATFDNGGGALSGRTISYTTADLLYAAAFDAGGGGSLYTLAADTGTFAITGQAAGTLLGPYWTYVGKTEAAVSASGNYTLTEPSGVQQGDVLVVDFATRSNVIYTNADWTFPQSDTTGNTTNNTTGSIVSYQTGYCIRGSSAPSYVFSRTGGSRALGTVRAYRSSRAGTPTFDTSAEVAMGAAGTTVTLTGGVTTTGIDELITTGVYGARANTVSNMDGTTEVTGNSGSTDTTTQPVLGTWTERSDRSNGTSPTVALAVYDTIKRTAGSTGNLTATESQSARHGMTAMAFKHPAASGSPYTLTADRGIFSITGVAAGLKRGLKVGANAASFAITGQDAGLKKGFKVGANVGTFTLGGQAANFVRTYVSPSSAGAFAITGQTVGLRTALGFTALHGAFSLSGQSAGLKVGKVVTANAGSYAITGQDADLIYTPASVNYTLTADVGTFSITGQNAGLARGLKTSANAGSYSITGQSAVLRYGRSMGSASGTYLITGQDATLRHNTLVGFAPGAFNITGQTVNLRLNRNLSSGTGTFSINGQDVILRKTTNMLLSPAEFNITGVSANLFLNKNLPSSAGSYLITGNDVTFTLGETRSFLLEAEKASYLISGKDVNLLYGVKIGGLSLIRPHYTKVKSNPPKLPERTFDKIHPVEEIRKAAARLSSAGGHARAAALSQKQRTQIASIAAKARWK